MAASSARKITLEHIPENGQQMAALRAIIDWYLHGKSQEFYLAGFAGAGKTTLAGIVVAELAARVSGNFKVLYASYTGKAAYELGTKTGETASTLHQLIYTVEERGESFSFVLNKNSPLRSAQLLVVDEISNVNDAMAADLRSFGIKILVLGDPGQLSPVEGEPAFTNRKPDFFLTEVHRQAKDSPIIRLATMAREGKPIPFGDYGNGVVKLRRDAEAMPLVASNDTQVLCGLNRIRWSVTRWRRGLRGHATSTPQPGERLLSCRNRHAEGLFNGSMGVAERIAAGEEDSGYVIDFRDDHGILHCGLQVPDALFEENYRGDTIEKPRTYFDRDNAFFDWADVLSVHKAQGSGFPHVTLLDDSRAFRRDAVAWLYTGITRAESGLVILSNYQ